MWKPYIYFIINVDLVVEGVFCSPCQLSLGILSILNLTCNWDFVFYIFRSCLNLRFWLFKFLDLAWNWDILWINSLFLLGFESKQAKILNLCSPMQNSLLAIDSDYKSYVNKLYHSVTTSQKCCLKYPNNQYSLWSFYFIHCPVWSQHGLHYTLTATFV